MYPAHHELERVNVTMIFTACSMWPLQSGNWQWLGVAKCNNAQPRQTCQAMLPPFENAQRVLAWDVKDTVGAGVGWGG